MARKGIPEAVREGRKSEEVVSLGNPRMRGGGTKVAMSGGSKFVLLLLLGASLLFGLHIIGLVIFSQLLILAWRHPIATIVAFILIFYVMKVLWRSL